MQSKFRPLSILLATSALMFIPAPAFANERDLPCPDIACRGVFPYGNCTPPYHVFDGSLEFVGKITELTRSACGKTQITIDVLQSSPSSLPSTINISLGPCMFLQHDVGAVIRALVSSVPVEGIYQARMCYSK